MKFFLVIVTPPPWSLHLSPLSFSRNGGAHQRSGPRFRNPRATTKPAQEWAECPPASASETSSCRRRSRYPSDIPGESTEGMATLESRLQLPESRHSRKSYH